MTHVRAPKRSFSAFRSAAEEVAMKSESLRGDGEGTHQKIGALPPVNRPPDLGLKNIGKLSGVGSDDEKWDIGHG